LGPETQKAIWGNRPELLGKIKRFVSLADKVSLSSSLTEPVSKQGSSLLAFGQFAGVVSAVRNAGGAVLQGDGTQFALSLGSAGSLVLTPQVLARLMTRPETIDVATQALKTPSASKTGRELSFKLMNLVMAQAQ